MKALFILSFGILLANPADHKVIVGSADVSREGNRLNVTASDRSVIEWGHFSIDKGETAHFSLPNASSKVLNRVVGPNASLLKGQLLSNGQVILINPNGIVFGAGSVVRTASLIASTLDVHQSQFVEGGPLQFKAVENAGAVIHEGSIEAKEIYLIGPEIQTKGSLKGDRVELAVGTEVWMRPDEEQALWIKTPAENISIGIDQSGQIEANQISLSAEGSYEWAINQTGIIKASSKGRISLTSQDGKICAGGTIDGSSSDGIGADLHIYGKEIFVPENGYLSTEGSQGGGKIFIGGDFQGKNREVPNSQATLLAEGAMIRSSCTQSGDAGQIIVWSDGLTFCESTIEAKGGPMGGNGGFVEVSGQKSLHFRTSVDRSAPQGSSGELFLDPSDITITGAANSANVAFAAGTYTINAALPSPANILTTDISANLLLGPVTVTTASPFADAGNIDITSSITIPGTNGLTLIADGTISLTDATIVSVLAAPINIQSGQDLILSTPTGMSAVIASIGGVINVNVGRDVQLINNGPIGSATNEVYIGVGFGGSSTFVTAGQDIILNNQSLATSPNPAAMGATNQLQITAGRDITFINRTSFLLSAFGPIDIIAGRNVTIPDLAGILVVDANAQITVVVDNQAPTAPNIGDGGLFVAQLGLIGTAPSGPIPPFPPPANVRLFTARRSQNNISNINFSTFVPGTTLQNSSTEVFGIWYPSSISTSNPFRYTVFYKEHEELPFVATVVGDSFDTLQVFQYPQILTLYEDVARFCVRVVDGEQQSETWYPIFLENYRERARSASPSSGN